MHITISAAGYTKPYFTISRRVNDSTWMSFIRMSANSFIILLFFLELILIHIIQSNQVFAARGDPQYLVLSRIGSHGFMADEPLEVFLDFFFSYCHIYFVFDYSTKNRRTIAAGLLNEMKNNTPNCKYHQYMKDL